MTNEIMKTSFPRLWFRRKLPVHKSREKGERRKREGKKKRVKGCYVSRCKMGWWNMYKWRTMRRHARSNNSLESLTTPSGDFFFLPRCSNFSITPASMETFWHFLFFFSLSLSPTHSRWIFYFNIMLILACALSLSLKRDSKRRERDRDDVNYRSACLLFFLFFFIRCICMNAMNNEIGIGENLVRIDHLAVFVQLIRVNVSNFTPIYDKNLFVNDYCLSSWENGI